MKKVLVFVMMILSVSLYAQKESSIKTTEIKTFICCEGCVGKIEHDLAYTKGVKDVKADLETNTVTVKYNSKQTTPETLCNELVAIGFDANGAKGSEKARAKMSGCCRGGLETGVRDDHGSHGGGH